MNKSPFSTRVTSCASCTINKCKCKSDCILAPYFSYPGSELDYRPIHEIFGTKNFTRIISKIPIEKRQIAVRSFIYEAHERYKEPVLGCISYLLFLETQHSKLKEELASLKANMYKGPSNDSVSCEKQPTNVEADVEASPNCLEHLVFSPSSSWVTPSPLGEFESSSPSHSSNFPLSPSISVTPSSLPITPLITQDQPTGSASTWTALQAEYFDDFSSLLEAPNVVSSSSDPLFIEPITAIAPSPETHPYSFFNLPCIRTERVNSNSCSSSRSISPMVWPL